MLGVAVGATAREVKVAYHAISRLGISPNSLVYNLNPNQRGRGERRGAWTTNPI